MKRHERFDLSYSEWEHLIDEWILDKRNRKILKEFLLDNVSMKSLASEYNLSKQAIQKIIYKSEDKLFSKVANK